MIFGTTGASEIYTRDAAAVCVEHSEEVELDMPSMAFKIRNRKCLVFLQTTTEVLRYEANFDV